MQYKQKLKQLADDHLQRVAFLLDDVKPLEYMSWLKKSGVYIGDPHAAQREAHEYKQLYEEVSMMGRKHRVVSARGRKRLVKDANVFRVATV